MLQLLCHTDELVDDKWMTFTTQEADDETYMVKKIGEKVYIYHNFCPHQGRRLDYAPGEYLETPDHQVVCPAHGATFKTEDGFCTGGPCAGQALRAVTTKIQGNEVFIDVE
ncbi:MAG: Rieske (2Fe-2S) protein [Proteobacteria bacterium]|nr:Rieske (2Fe-2S) protein [Pseudomonadota bacterium]